MGKTRPELLAALGLLDPVEPVTKRAFKHHEEKVWRGKLDDSPHGIPWHESFHASSFPGDDDRACGRYAVYGLMDVPGHEPAPRKLRGQATVGSAVEDMLVERWGSYGVLLSNSHDSDYQTNFTDEEHWLTGNCDALIVPEGWDRPHVVEVKTKAHEVVLAMKRLQRGPDDKHVRQCKTYIGRAHEEADRWPDYKPCMSGTIYYCSRDDPEFTRSFFYSYDPNFMAQGRARLAAWRDNFQRGELPEHPFGGKEWSQLPCKWCKYKKHACKPDETRKVEGKKEPITRLRDSHGIDWADEVYDFNYDYDKTRKAVLDRWNAEDLETA